MPDGYVVGDFDGDSHPDVVVCESGGDVDVLRNDGTGGFDVPVSFHSTNVCESMQAADFDEDGKLDILMSVYHGSVALLLGDGKGGFQVQPSQTVGGYDLAGLAVGDLNGDRHMDAVALMATGASVAVLLGNGNGTFRTQTIYSAFQEQVLQLGSNLLLADVTGDAKPDIIMMDNMIMAVLTNLGNGTFQTRDIGFNFLGYWLAAADFNNDAKIDLIVADDQNSNLQVLLNPGQGDFENPSVHPTAGGLDRVVTADFDRDGNPDVVISNGSVAVLMGRGGGTFGPQQNYSMGAGAVDLFVVDVNGDSRPDVLTVNSDRSLSVLLNASK